jgi:hypothetical protein
MFSSNTSAVSGDANYIEDVFSTYLYTGNSSTQTITNGIDLAGKGGLVWIKSRSTVNSNTLFDTQRGALNVLQSNATSASTSAANSLTSFNSTGFSLGTDPSNQWVNFSGVTYASWTFREQPKFFDVVTWTGTGANRTIAHSLGAVPGCIIVKRTDTTGAWQVYHRSLANTEYMVLNTTAAKATGATRWNSTTPTDTVFSLGTDATVNASGGTYVAYVFAHNAGGFGLAGTDNVISCGSFTADGSGNATVNLGYEPQWAMVKLSSDLGGWCMVDSMRGNATLNGTTNTEQLLLANGTAAESSTYGVANPTSTGFQAAGWAAGATLIYIAIRRGPMRSPTTGTSVLGLSARSGTGADATVTGSAGVTDLAIIKNRASTPVWAWASRLTNTGYLSSNATTAETAAGVTILQANPWDVMDGVKVGTTSTITNASSNTFINYLIDRAPGFMDISCYTGTGVARTVAHNLTVMPELIIVKMRSAGQNWIVGTQFGATQYTAIYLNSSAAAIYPPQTANYTPPNASAGFGAQPTASTFTTDATTLTNSSGNTYVAYLFASCPGVSKVGSYTGTGTTQQINCGFSAGARFVLIKRTDSTGDWYVWDTARGIVAGNDPYSLVNSTAAEVTNTDYVDTFSSGFEISSTAPAAINASGGSFIFLAIA